MGRRLACGQGGAAWAGRSFFEPRVAELKPPNLHNYRNPSNSPKSQNPHSNLKPKPEPETPQPISGQGAQASPNQLLSKACAYCPAPCFFGMTQVNVDLRSNQFSGKHPLYETQNFHSYFSGSSLPPLPPPPLRLLRHMRSTPWLPQIGHDFPGPGLAFNRRKHPHAFGVPKRPSS